jgi:hypothetical protein
MMYSFFVHFDSVAIFCRLKIHLLALERSHVLPDISRFLPISLPLFPSTATAYKITRTSKGRVRVPLPNVGDDTG